MLMGKVMVFLILLVWVVYPWVLFLRRFELLNSSDMKHFLWLLYAYTYYFISIYEECTAFCHNCRALFSLFIALSSNLCLVLQSMSQYSMPQLRKIRWKMSECVLALCFIASIVFHVLCDTSFPCSEWCEIWLVCNQPSNVGF